MSKQSAEQNVGCEKTGMHNIQSKGVQPRKYITMITVPSDGIASVINVHKHSSVSCIL